MAKVKESEEENSESIEGREEENSSDSTTEEQPAKRSNPNTEKKKLEKEFAKGSTKGRQQVLKSLEAKGYEIIFDDDGEMLEVKKSESDDDTDDPEKKRLINDKIREKKRADELEKKYLERELRDELSDMMPKGVKKSSRVLTAIKEELDYTFRKLPNGDIRVYHGDSKNPVKDDNEQFISAKQVIEDFVSDNPEFLLTDYRPNGNGSATGSKGSGSDWSKLSDAERFKAADDLLFGDKKPSRWKDLK